VTTCRRNKKIYLGLLLCLGAAGPALGWAHSEGIEAADPSTPAALLRFSGATAGYTHLESAPRSWRERFSGNNGTETRSAHGINSGHNPAESSLPRAAPQAPPTAEQ